MSVVQLCWQWWCVAVCYLWFSFFLALGGTVVWDFGFVREHVFCLGFSVISTVGSFCFSGECLFRLLFV